MTERPTPLVDAKQLHCVEDASGYYFVPSDFARTLERDRAELMEALKLSADSTCTCKACRKARALLARLEK